MLSQTGTTPPTFPRTAAPFFKNILSRTGTTRPFFPRTTATTPKPRVPKEEQPRPLFLGLPPRSSKPCFLRIGAARTVCTFSNAALFFKTTLSQTGTTPPAFFRATASFFKTILSRTENPFLRMSSARSVETLAFRRARSFWKYSTSWATRHPLFLKLPPRFQNHAFPNRNHPTRFFLKPLPRLQSCAFPNRNHPPAFSSDYRPVLQNHAFSE